ncbi:MAG: sulfotransferase [Bradyrhizobium sp.]
MKAVIGTRSVGAKSGCVSRLKRVGHGKRASFPKCQRIVPSISTSFGALAARKVRASPIPPQDVYVDGLRCLASALETPGRYDEPALRLLQRELFVRILADLSVSRDIAVHPEISDIPVKRPLLVTGSGRTGSTLLHNLLALDPHARAPLLWELGRPHPHRIPTRQPPICASRARSGGSTGPRRPIRKSCSIHPMEARAPDECHWMMRHNALLPMFYQVPEYWEWLKQLSHGDLGEPLFPLSAPDPTSPAVDTGRLLDEQVHHPSAFHAGAVRRLSRCQYRPAASRSLPCGAVPVQSRFHTPSPASQVDQGEIGSTLLDMFVDNMNCSMAAPANKADQIADIRFEDLVVDLIAAVRAIYRRFGYPYDETFERAMTRPYLERERAAARPRHTYALEQFGLSPGEVT